MSRLISRKNLAYPRIDGQVLSSDSKGVQSWVDNKIVGISTLGSTVGTANTIKFASGIGVTIVAGVASVTVETASNATQLNSQAASYYLNYNNFSNTPTVPTNNNQLTNGAGFITATSSGSGLTGIVTSIVAGTNVTISQSTGIVTINSSGGGGGGGGASRDTATLTIGSIASGITTTGNVTLPKTGVLISVHPVGIASGWLRLYTRSDLATADASRVRTVDPDPGSGVILETITSGISTVYLSPQTIFSSAEDTPINTFNYRFTKDGTAGITTFTFKYVSLES